MPPLEFAADEHVPRAVIRGLRARGLSVQTAQEAGLLGAEDAAHLASARVVNRVLITQDADFLRLAAAGEPHAGIVYFRQGTKVGDMIRHLLLVGEVLSSEEMANHIEFF